MNPGGGGHGGRLGGMGGHPGGMGHRPGGMGGGYPRRGGCCGCLTPVIVLAVSTIVGLTLILF